MRAQDVSLAAIGTPRFVRRARGWFLHSPVARRQLEYFLAYGAYDENLEGT